MRTVKQKAEALIGAIKENNPELNENQDLSELCLKDEGAFKIAEALKTNTHITKIYLSNNFFTDVGARSIISALKNNTTVLMLSFSKPTIINYFMENNIALSYQVEADLLGLRNSVIARIKKQQDVFGIKETLFQKLEDEIIKPFFDLAKKRKNLSSPWDPSKIPFNELCGTHFDKFSVECFSTSEDWNTFKIKAMGLLKNLLSNDSPHWKMALCAVPNLGGLVGRYINKLRIVADLQDGQHPFKTGSLLEMKFFRKKSASTLSIWESQTLPDDCLDKISPDLKSIKSNPQRRKFESLKNNDRYMARRPTLATLALRLTNIPSDWIPAIECNPHLLNLLVDLERAFWALKSVDDPLPQLITLLKQLPLPPELSMLVDENPSRIEELLATPKPLRFYAPSNFTHYAIFSRFEGDKNGPMMDKDLIAVDKNGEILEMSKRKFLKMLKNNEENLNNLKL